MTADSPAAGEAKSEEKPVATEAPAVTTTAPPKSEAADTGSGKVRLGSPELTAGIPGEGPLTVAQVEAWLADPKNHEILSVELPLGLSLGVIPADVLAANPMTRAKIELGRQLYFDTRLSSDNTVSCASCHHPDHGYAR